MKSDFILVLKLMDFSFQTTHGQHSHWWRKQWKAAARDAWHGIRATLVLTVVPYLSEANEPIVFRFSGHLFSHRIVTIPPWVVDMDSKDTFGEWQVNPADATKELGRTIQHIDDAIAIYRTEQSTGS